MRGRRGVKFLRGKIIQTIDDIVLTGWFLLKVLLTENPDIPGSRQKKTKNDVIRYQYVIRLGTWMCALGKAKVNFYLMLAKMNNDVTIHLL